VQAVPGEGRPRAKVMIVGEGPGRDEDRIGRPFVGRAGRLLEDLLASAGLSRDDVYITNIIKCRAITATVPPRDRPPAPQEISACAPWLVAQRALLQPRIVVTLGRHALEAFVPGARLGEVHGRPQQKGAQTILPLYHPSYALHSPKARPVLFADICVLAGLMKGPRGTASP
jgi:uracil-DNA glycosylase